MLKDIPKIHPYTVYHRKQHYEHTPNKLLRKVIGEKNENAFIWHHYRASL